MSRYGYSNGRSVQLNDPKDDDNHPNQPQPSNDDNNNNKEDLKPFMGVKARRLASFRREYKGDYLDVPAQPYVKILDKQGDRQILFADKVLKFTGTGKIKRRILIITDYAVYIIDPETSTLKRRITLAAVEKLYLSTLCDNFFVIGIPTEYDILMASTRKTEIVTVLVDATKNASNFDLKVLFKNRFEYNPTADLVKEVIFEEVDGGVKTRIETKPEDD